jgi:hypothetical protein
MLEVCRTLQDAPDFLVAVHAGQVFRVGHGALIAVFEGGAPSRILDSGAGSTTLHVKHVFRASDAAPLQDGV